jgi:beta-lactamase class A
MHVRALDREAEIGINEDEPVVLASVSKVAVALELFRQAAAGELDAGERVVVSAGKRAPGVEGISVMRDDVEMSLRDLALLMLTISDNAATDAVLARVGLARVNQTLRELGLTKTVLRNDSSTAIQELAEDLGFRDWEELLGADHGSLDVTATRMLRPEDANCSTAREQTELLELIWHDRAGPGAACADLRRMMALQLERGRLAAGFAADVLVSGKTGQIGDAVRNEIGVVEYPEGDRYAVAVFTRFAAKGPPRTDVDRMIGAAAALAVEQVRRG